MAEVALALQHRFDLVERNLLRDEPTRVQVAVVESVHALCSARVGAIDNAFDLPGGRLTREPQVERTNRGNEGLIALPRLPRMGKVKFKTVTKSTREQRHLWLRNEIGNSPVLIHMPIPLEHRVVTEHRFDALLKAYTTHRLRLVPKVVANAGRVHRHKRLAARTQEPHEPTALELLELFLPDEFGRLLDVNRPREHKHLEGFSGVLRVSVQQRFEGALKLV